MGYSKSKKLIEKIEKGQPGGNLFGCVDIPDGTWSVNELLARDEATAQAFIKQYGADQQSMGENDKAPIPGDKLKPTPEKY